jgi:DNA-binding XRE family transcriptional regulator
LNIEIKKRRGRDAGPDVELWIALCKTVALMIRRLPQADQSDVLELIKAMADSDEEMESGVETLREILLPQGATIAPLEFPGGRPGALQNWAEYAGGRVREFRKQAGFTQEQLAEKSGLPQSHLSRIESGEYSPNRLTLEKIARALSRKIRDFDPSEK